MFTSAFRVFFQDAEINAITKDGDGKHLQAFICKCTFRYCGFNGSLEF